MSFILDYRNWKRIFEQAVAAATVVGVKSKVAFTGATTHPAPNASALAEMKKGLSINIVGSQVITENDAITKTADGDINNWKIIPKTIKAKDYLKIGNLILNGDSKKAATIKLIISDLGLKPIEAAGNGIFALSRALLLKNKELRTSPQTPLIIGLNTLKADSFIANADTAFQSPIGDFTNSGLRTFLVSKAIKSNPGNTETNTVMCNKWAQEARDTSTMANMSIMPNIPTEYSEGAKTISPIDFNAFIAKIKNKNISSYTPELQGYVDEYVNTFFDPFLVTYSERFKSFLTKSAVEIGILPTLFQELMDYINTWKTGQVSKKEEYKADLVKEIKDILLPLLNKTPVSRPGAEASGKVVTGTVGKIAR